jgi:tRNA (guanine37-N1)-methyltransferase
MSSLSGRSGRPVLRIDVLTIFPRMFEGAFSESLLGKARDKGLVDIRVHDLRDFTDDKHRTVDDRPFGGGPGMVMKPEPIFQALRALGAARKSKARPRVIYLSPQGRPFDQRLAVSLSKEKRLVLLCGHYEGIDERLSDFIDMEIALGDAVFTGGEIPAMAVVDAVARLLPGVVKDPESIRWDSFSEGWAGFLDCPHFTRPALWRGRKVPEVLLGGDHRAIAEWRRRMAAENTRRKRPDLLKISKIKKSETKP